LLVCSRRNEHFCPNFQKETTKSWFLYSGTPLVNFRNKINVVPASGILFYMNTRAIRRLLNFTASLIPLSLQNFFNLKSRIWFELGRLSFHVQSHWILEYVVQPSKDIIAVPNDSFEISKIFWYFKINQPNCRTPSPTTKSSCTQEHKAFTTKFVTNIYNAAMQDC
jgi:hypothetical protein